MDYDWKFTCIVDLTLPFLQPEGSRMKRGFQPLFLDILPFLFLFGSKLLVSKIAFLT